MSRNTALSKVALTDQVTTLLEERILDQIYRSGERLNIDALSREFKVSSSPIREALTRLTGAGLVASTSYSGFSVAPVPTRAWFEQLRDYRIIAEGWAARSLARLRTPDILAQMESSLQALHGETIGVRARDYIPVSRADEAFHNALLDAGGNQILAQSVRRLQPHLQHARLFSHVQQEVEPVIQEHRALLDAISVGDEEGAAAALTFHLVASWQRYDAWLAGDGAG